MISCATQHYTMTVKLVGIDVSDERISVGEIPPIEVDPTEMPANKGGEKDIQITARPGQEWVFDMPDWLSALLDGRRSLQVLLLRIRGLPMSYLKLRRLILMQKRGLFLLISM